MGWGYPRSALSFRHALSVDRNLQTHGAARGRPDFSRLGCAALHLRCCDTVSGRTPRAIAPTTSARRLHCIRGIVGRGTGAGRQDRQPHRRQSVLSKRAVVSTLAAPERCRQQNCRFGGLPHKFSQLLASVAIHHRNLRADRGAMREHQRSLWYPLIRRLYRCRA